MSPSEHVPWRRLSRRHRIGDENQVLQMHAWSHVLRFCFSEWALVLHKKPLGLSVGLPDWTVSISALIAVRSYVLLLHKPVFGGRLTCERAA